MSIAGIRPRDYPPELLALSDDLGLLPDGALPLPRYYAMLDSGDIDGAEALLSELLARVDGSGILISRSDALVTREAVFFFAFVRNDVTPARMRRNGTRGRRFMLPHSEARVKAALLFADGNLSEARAAALHGRKAVERSVMPGMATFDRQALEQIVSATERTALAGARL